MECYSCQEILTPSDVVNGIKKFVCNICKVTHYYIITAKHLLLGLSKNIDDDFYFSINFVTGTLSIYKTYGGVIYRSDDIYSKYKDLNLLNNFVLKYLKMKAFH